MESHQLSQRFGVSCDLEAGPCLILCFFFLYQTMWIERTTYRTAYTFPGILKWFEAKEISVVSHLKS